MLKIIYKDIERFGNVNACICIVCRIRRCWMWHVSIMFFQNNVHVEPIRKQECFDFGTVYKIIRSASTF